MSRLLPDHIRIGLGASYAVLARLDGARIAYWQMQTWEPANTPTPWQQALAVISSWLAELKPRGQRIGIALSAELAPLHLLPWRDDVARADQQALLAAGHFRRVHGEAAEHWSISAKPTGYGRPWLAGAMDERLLQALPGQLQGGTLTTLQPLSLSLFNSMHRHISEPVSWLLVPEPSRLTVLNLRDKQWSLIKTLAGHGFDGEPIGDRLLRESRLAGLPDRLGTVYSPARAAGIMLLDTGWRRSAAIPADSPLHLLGGRA